jgi:hypothetical protein
MTVWDKLTKSGPRKLLAIDGGGIRGVLALEILAEIETILRTQARREEFVLADYFDYIAGTSTGGIIAAGLALGMRVQELLDFYENCATDMFGGARLLERLRYRYHDEPLAKKLRDVLGADVTLGSDKLRTLLMMVLRNATTDSPWPLSNNPYGRYNASDHPGRNLNLPLWQLVRASTAAPTYFPPEVIVVGDQQFVFVDGGVTMYNNPAHQLFLMATVERYWQNAPDGIARGWETGPDRMLLVSVGTGTSPAMHEKLDPSAMNLLFSATTIPSALMFAALNEQDLLCRVFGECLVGDPLDREVGDMIGRGGPGLPKLYTYHRYNAELSHGGLELLGCGDVAPEDVRKLDAIDAIPALRRVGRAVAQAHVKRENFERFPV